MKLVDLSWRPLAALACAAAAGAALATAAISAEGTAPATAAISAEGTATARPVVRLRIHDSGRTVHLRHGATISVRLGPNGLVWAAPTSSNPRVATRVSLRQHRVGGLQATLRAVRAGRTTLTSTGSCPPPVPGSATCQLVELWRVSLIVS